MKLFKSNNTTATRQASSRRSFIWQTGAAVTAGLAAAVLGMAKTTDDAQDLKQRLARVQDENAIRDLQRSYETLLDSARYDEVAGLFTTDAEVLFNGARYRGKAIGQLYSDHFRTNRIGRKLTPASAIDTKADVIEVSGDGRTARASFSYCIQTGEPLPGESVLVQMARLHGEGIRQWREEGVYELIYVKEHSVGGWKIARLKQQVSAIFV